MGGEIASCIDEREGGLSGLGEAFWATLSICLSSVLSPGWELLGGLGWLGGLA